MISFESEFATCDMKASSPVGFKWKCATAAVDAAAPVGSVRQTRLETNASCVRDTDTN